MIKKILLVLLLILSTLVGVYAGKMTSTLDTMDRDTKKLSDVDLGDVHVTSDNDITNILLIGADKRAELGDEENGRSDTVMIATIDNKHNMLKLTSLMRDMWVDIPGYNQNKFNAAYAFGGAELLYKTIATNFGIQLDGYMEVDFDAFRKIVDKCGGVQVELTEQEANYLNTTNYIQRKKYRNVVPGVNKMNGWQALGYCRIRKIANINGTNNDMGRTERQRMVMQSIFEKVKAMPMSKWSGIIKAVLPDVKTDISNSEILSYATSIVGMGTTKINSYRIPVDGYFTSSSGSDSRGSVLDIDFDSNKQFLQDFIFDYDGSGSEPGMTEDSSTTEAAGGAQ